jgi:hypothetical protein
MDRVSGTHRRIRLRHRPFDAVSTRQAMVKKLGTFVEFKDQMIRHHAMSGNERHTSNGKIRRSLGK